MLEYVQLDDDQSESEKRVLSAEQQLALDYIEQKTDPEHLRKVRELKLNTCGHEGPVRVPTFIFSGPPGTGKTAAFRAIAAKSGRRAYSLDAAKLKNNMYNAPGMFRDVLAYVGDEKPATRLPAKDLADSRKSLAAISP